MMANKATLRKKILQERRSFSVNKIASLSAHITDLFFTLDLSLVHTLHCYLPIVQQCEIDTMMLIREFWQRFPAKKIIVSRTNISELSMDDMFVLEPNLLPHMVEGKWGIPELDIVVPRYTASIDAVLVPLLGFDAQGNRIGYGKGFYDRFLVGLETTPLKIGLCHTADVYQIDDIHPQDIPLDMCITPTGIVYF